ncbi:MAG: phenylalanine 4-monooxygenase [Sphingobacteriales bacterium]|nr:phenylalanine 4-monooxygenase [Sphingobacteriales bacterium]
MVQNYAAYTAQDFAVWKLLFERQMKILPHLAAPAYIEGIAAIGFMAEQIPNFDDINRRLEVLTGWRLKCVPGIIEEADFFQLLANREFPATSWLRRLDELDYLPEPDMFHDVFGHVPLLTKQVFCDFYENIGILGTQYLHNPQAVAMLGRLYWFTVEFGLMLEKDEKRIYGACILSSHSETKFSLSEVPQHLPFDAAKILNTPYENDKIQSAYFVIDSFEELFHSLAEVRQVLEQN